MSQLPNRVYYAQLADLTDEQWRSTVRYVMGYSAYEFVSYILLGLVLQIMIKMSGFKQVSFTLEKHWRLVQSLLVLWVFFVIQMSLKHLGSWLSRSLRRAPARVRPLLREDKPSACFGCESSDTRSAHDRHHPGRRAASQPSDRRVDGQNAAYWVRTFYSVLVITITSIVQFHSGISRLPLKWSWLLTATVVITSASVSFIFALHMIVGFPTPFLYQFTSSFWQCWLFASMWMMWKKTFREDPEAWEYMKRFIWLWLAQVAMIDDDEGGDLLSAINVP